MNPHIDMRWHVNRFSRAGAFEVIEDCVGIILISQLRKYKGADLVASFSLKLPMAIFIPTQSTGADRFSVLR